MMVCLWMKYFIFLIKNRFCPLNKTVNVAKLIIESIIIKPVMSLFIHFIIDLLYIFDKDMSFE